MPEASAEKKRPASAASNKEDSSDEKSEKSSRRSVTPEPAKKKKKIDPVRLFSLFTLPIAKILSVKNARAWVSMVAYLKK